MKTSIETRVVTVGTTSGQLVGSNPRRVALFLSCPPTNRITISWLPTAVLDEGVNLYPADPALKLLASEMGNGIAQPITAISAVASQGVAVTEVTEAP